MLDFCAGAGGKSLAFAHKVTGKGALHLHDIPPLLNEAQRRLKRAGADVIVRNWGTHAHTQVSRTLTSMRSTTNMYGARSVAAIPVGTDACAHAG